MYMYMTVIIMKTCKDFFANIYSLQRAHEWIIRYLDGSFGLVDSFMVCFSDHFLDQPSQRQTFLALGTPPSFLLHRVTWTLFVTEELGYLGNEHHVFDDLIGQFICQILRLQLCYEVQCQTLKLKKVYQSVINQLFKQNIFLKTLLIGHKFKIYVCF